LDFRRHPSGRPRRPEGSLFEAPQHIADVLKPLIFGVAFVRVPHSLPDLQRARGRNPSDTRPPAVELVAAGLAQFSQAGPLRRSPSPRDTFI